eukprot:13687986-Alexandrium_andersonii.AAC.1
MEVKTIHTNPCNHGWPVRRGRNFSFCYNAERFFWVGPASDADIQRDFESLFGQSLECSPSVFEVATQGQIAAHMRVLGQRRGFFVEESDIQAGRFNPLRLLPPGQRQRWQSYRDAHPGC